MFTKAKQTFKVPSPPSLLRTPRVLFFSKGVKDNTAPSPSAYVSARHPKMFFLLAATGSRQQLLLPPFSSSLIESATLRLHGSWASSRNFYGVLFYLVVQLYTLLIVLPHFYSQRRNRSYACCGAFYVYRVAGFWKLWPPAKQELNEQLLACLIGYCIGKALPHFMLFYAYTLVNGMCPLGCVLTMMY